MAYIKVEFDEIEKTALAVEEYVIIMKENMFDAKSTVNALSSNWKGADYAQFKRKWDLITHKNSTYGNMLKAFESYARFLRYAERQYKDTQRKVQFRAKSLPRYY